MNKLRSVELDLSLQQRRAKNGLEVELGSVDELAVLAHESSALLGAILLALELVVHLDNDVVVARVVAGLHVDSDVQAGLDELHVGVSELAVLDLQKVLTIVREEVKVGTPVDVASMRHMEDESGAETKW